MGQVKKSKKYIELHIELHQILLGLQVFQFFLYIPPYLKNTTLHLKEIREESQHISPEPRRYLPTIPQNAPVKNNPPATATTNTRNNHLHSSLAFHIFLRRVTVLLSGTVWKPVLGVNPRVLLVVFLGKLERGDASGFGGVVFSSCGGELEGKMEGWR